MESIISSPVIYLSLVNWNIRRRFETFHTIGLSIQQFLQVLKEQVHLDKLVSP